MVLFLPFIKEVTHFTHNVGQILSKPVSFCFTFRIRRKQFCAILHTDFIFHHVLCHFGHFESDPNMPSLYRLLIL